MKKRSLSGFIILSIMLMGVVLFAGCATGDNADVMTENTENAQAQTMVETIPESVSDEQAMSECMIDVYKSLTIKGHSFETIDITEDGRHYVARDTVSMDIEAGDPSGMIPQNISKKVEFLYDSDNAHWVKGKETCTAWNVNNEALPGSCWKSETLKTSDMKTWMGDKIENDDNGQLFIRFKNKMGFFAIAINDENNSPKKQPFFTNASGVFTWIGENGIVEQNFKCMEGIITDEGELTLKLSSDKGEGEMIFTANATHVSDREYDEAINGGAASDTLYIEELKTFNVSTISLEGDMWKKECGSRHGNVSPELSWEAVDGATGYAVFMLDKDASNWLHMCVMTDRNGLKEGEYDGKEAGYVGPYPPEKHEYDVYVIALKDMNETLVYNMDSTGTDISDKLNKLNISQNGETGNVISYGMIRGFYEPSEDEENILR